MADVKYGTRETSPGNWHVTVECPGNAAMLNIDGGELPKGEYRPWPQFTSKEQAEGFIQGLEFGLTGNSNA